MSKTKQPGYRKVATKTRIYDPEMVRDMMIAALPIVAVAKRVAPELQHAVVRHFVTHSKIRIAG
jgi:hypothetical protein